MHSVYFLLQKNVQRMQIAILFQSVSNLKIKNSQLRLHHLLHNIIDKQEAHGPHRSPEKTVQIIKQIWLYHNVDSENKEKKLWEFIGSSFGQTWITFTQGCFVPRLVEIGPVVLEKKIFKFQQCIFTIS